jgi:UDP-glucuronate decarboxylase
VVTGGAGFIGSHLCDRLIEAGHHVICIDNLQTGSRANIGALLAHPRFTFIKHDIRTPPRLRKPIDQIFNLACPASPPHYQRDPIATMQTCVMGAINMLEIARANNARILQASTSEVYGDPQAHPQHESYWGNVNPIGPRACYDEGKRAAETLFFDYRRAHGVSIRVARIFNTYGPRMSEDDGRVVSNFIVRALRGEPLAVYGDGSQTRSFCYVDDLVRGLLALMRSDAEDLGPSNLGNPHEMTIASIAELVLRLTKSRSSVVRHPLPQDDPSRRRPVIDQASSLLDWRPGIDLQQGLEATIEYFAARNGAHSLRETRPDAALMTPQLAMTPASQKSERIM